MSTPARASADDDQRGLLRDWGSFRRVKAMMHPRWRLGSTRLVGDRDCNAASSARGFPLVLRLRKHCEVLALPPRRGSSGRHAHRGHVSGAISRGRTSRVCRASRAGPAPVTDHAVPQPRRPPCGNWIAQVVQSTRPHPTALGRGGTCAGAFDGIVRHAGKDDGRGLGAEGVYGDVSRATRGRSTGWRKRAVTAATAPRRRHRR